MSTEITPGGTITLARGAATVKGIVTQYAADSIYSRRAGKARSVVPAVNIEDLGPFPLGGPGGMEVVDFQPAPEPEPVDGPSEYAALVRFHTQGAGFATERDRARFERLAEWLDDRASATTSGDGS